MDRVQLLISGYLDSELSDDEAAQLAGTLTAGGDSLDRLVIQSFIHAQMLEWMDHQGAMSRASMAGSGNDTSRRRGFSYEGAAHSGMPLTRTRYLPMRAIAAAIFVAAGVLSLAYVLTTRPTVVGQLTQATSCRWSQSPPALSVGALLQDGQELVLEQGAALITFVSGAQLRLEGPTSLRLVSAKEAHLHYGQIAAKVPTTARGFTVTSPLARFIDLGTAFTLKLDAEKSFQLHVFEGLVELQLDRRFGASAQQPVRVAEVRAVTFDVDSREVAVQQFEEGKQMPF